MTKISSKSKRRVIRLLTPPTARTGLDRVAPFWLTVNKLMNTKRGRKLKGQFSMIQIEGDNLICIANLEKLGFDFIG